MSPYQKPATQHELRQRLFTCIDKLSDRSTYTQSSNELIHLAKSLPLDHLPTFLSCILTVDSSTKSPVRVHCVNLVSTLADTHGSLLSPHLSKIIGSIVKRVREPDSGVRSACAGAVTSLAPLNHNLILDSFVNCVSTEQELQAQIGGCLCLKAAVDAVDGRVSDGGDEIGELRRKVLPKVLKLVKSDGFKAKGGLLGVLVSLVGVNGGIVINLKNNGGSSSSLMGNVVSCAVDMLSNDDWCARKAAAEVLQVVAEFVDVEYGVEVKSFVVNALESRRFDKVKVTRETMNRAWEAWKEVEGGPDEVSPLSRSNSSLSKDTGNGGGSPPLPRRSSYAGGETPKPNKSMFKCRSSLTDGAFANVPPSMSQDFRNKSLSKSRSCLSDDSTNTDSSSVSRSSYDYGFESPQVKKYIPKTRKSLPDGSAVSRKSVSKSYDKKSSSYQNAGSRKSSDWKFEIATPATSSANLVSEDDLESEDKTAEVTSSSSEKRNSLFKGSEDRIKKPGFRYRTHVTPLGEEDEGRRVDVDRRAYEEVGKNIAESEELSQIRSQLLQIERQQSSLLDLVQKFMGNSQNGIDSLETRVSGLERALDVISHDLGIQTGRVLNNGSAGSTCCPSTEFLSPKFWWRVEGKSSTAKPHHAGSINNKDSNNEALQMDGHRTYEQYDGKSRDSWGSAEFNTTKNAKSMGQNALRGRTCSPRSFDTASNTSVSPVVRGS